MNEVRYPTVDVKLVGKDGNAYAILGAVVRALREASVSREAQLLSSETTAPLKMAPVVHKSFSRKG